MILAVRDENKYPIRLDNALPMQYNSTMIQKRECDLPRCTRRFTPKAPQQRFCCVKHRNEYHQDHRQQLVQMAREMGLRK